MSWFKKKPPYTKHISIQPPSPHPDRSGVAITSVVKNEGSYIGEWVRFHKAVGVRHFIIYDDGSTDETVEVLRNVLGKDELTLLPWAGRMVDTSIENMLNNQVLAFAHAILNFGGLYRWMAFIDVDEFLLPKSERTIEAALAHVDGFPNVSLPWHMFGTSGHETRPDGSVARNFILRAAEPIGKKKNITNFKCIVDPCEVNEVSVHLFGTRTFGSTTCNDAGQRSSRSGRKNPKFYSSQHLQLNHYYCKSEEELALKLSRGPASPASRQQYEERVRKAVENIEADLIRDDSMLHFLDRNSIALAN